MVTTVITGSTRGIGLGLARELAARTSNVVVCGRSQATVDAAIAEVADRAGADRVVGATCDVTNAGDVQNLWDVAVDAFGTVDHWINNAGLTTTPLPLHNVPSEQLGRVIDTNVTGVLHGVRVAAAGMREQDGGGWIWNVEGLGSKGETQLGLATYGASKAAVGYLMKALRKDLADTKVKIGAIRPGINITEHLLTDAEVLSPERWEKTKKIMNILGDLPETTTPWLAEQILAATKDGTRIQWLSTMEISKRFMLAPFNKRDLFTDVEAKMADHQ